MPETATLPVNERALGLHGTAGAPVFQNCTEGKCTGVKIGWGWMGWGGGLSTDAW